MISPLGIINSYKNEMPCFTNVQLYKYCRDIVTWNKNFNLFCGKLAEKDQRQKRDMPTSSDLLYLNSEEMDSLSLEVEHLSSMCEDLDSIFKQK